MGYEVLCRKRGLGKVVRKSASWIPVNPFTTPGALFYFYPGLPETSMGPTGIYSDSAGMPIHHSFSGKTVAVDTGWPCQMVTGANLASGEYLMGAYFMAVSPGEHTVSAKIISLGASDPTTPTPSDYFDFAPWCAEVLTMESAETMMMEGDSASETPYVFLFTPLRPAGDKGTYQYYGQQGHVDGEPENYAQVAYAWYAYSGKIIFPRSIMVLNAADPWFPDNPIVNVRVAVDAGDNDLFLEDFPQATLTAIVPGKSYLLPDGFTGDFLEVVVNDTDFYGSGAYTLTGQTLTFHGEISESSVVKAAYYPAIDNSVLRAVYTDPVSYPVVHHLSDTGGQFYLAPDGQEAIDSGHTVTIAVAETSLISVFMCWDYVSLLGGTNAIVEFALDDNVYRVSADTYMGEWGWTPPGSGDAPPGPLA